MENKTKYWKGIEELERTPEFVQLSKNEFAEGLPLDEVLNESDLDLSSNRRDFLKFFGFSVSAVALAACNKAPVKNVIPYVIKPEEVTPGVPNYYASTFGNIPVVVKTREGRPIKLEGNEKSSLTQGGLNAAGQASVLSLYDSHRLPVALKEGKTAKWADVDKEVMAKLESINSKGGQIRLVSGQINSPATRQIIAEFKASYPTAKHVVYEPVNYDGIILANEMSFGKAVVPTYQFGKADVIVSFGADFLGTWLNTVHYTKEYSKNRVPGADSPKMSRHYQFEANMSLTGTNADYRFPLRPSQEGAALMSLYNAIAKASGLTQLPTPAKLEVVGNNIEKAAKDLLAAKGKSLVVSGSNDPYIQSLVNQINSVLGNYGQTIDIDNYYYAKQGDQSWSEFAAEASKVAAVIFYGVNPVYDAANGTALAENIKKMELSVSLAYYSDETASLCQYVAPDNHWLESWDLTEISKGHYGFTQPTISPVFETRQAQATLAIWSKNAAIKNNEFNYYDYIREVAKNTVYAQASGFASFDAWWNQALHDGVYELPMAASNAPANNVLANDLVAKINTKADQPELILYTKVGLNDGKDGNNPWLHEMPDPVSKVCWDNYLAISKYDAAEMKLEQGDVVNVSNGAYTIEKLPVMIQPGQARMTFAIALGFGRSAGVKEAVGKNAFPFVGTSNGTLSYTTTNFKIEKAEGSYELAQTQTHHSIEGRDIVREASLGDYKKNAKAANEDHHGGLRKPDGKMYDLWKEFDYKGHKWGLAVDMNACTGCSACVISCSIENNVPVVGRDEVRRRREMHWIRIDRYYSFQHEGTYATKEDEYNHMDDHQNVRVIHQAMMCQHCDHAPCETVCPVLATTHSNEGLNQMTYNRCIGTKYCANNCPYKVRRFNWFRYNDNDNFNYYFNNDLGKMVINPDVTVRTRGVMEKCSMCVQRIQAGKLSAKLEGRKVQDGDIKTACQQSCPANAIVFGDMNDPESAISKAFAKERAYSVLEEINVQPSVRYMTKIRNVEESIVENAAHH
ncbi:MAG: 4Fe-4S dicluster domain-containing protein [Bacteroidetes bacterium]|nr:MAG: 4Fe-4S dicluster domain-containing protein [Bacteroidota bacterium]